MATRALVGFINDNNNKLELISTYNHYDGYPDNLGIGLATHYEEPNEALKIASTGYISYLDPETGEIDSKYQEPADVTPLSGDFEEAMMQIAQKGDRYGADYIYVYDIENSEWKYAKMYGTRQTKDELMKELQALEGSVFKSAISNLSATPDQMMAESTIDNMIESGEKHLEEGDPIIDEHEFTFFKTFFGQGSENVIPNTNATDQELESFLKSDDYQEELKYSDLEEKDLGNWIETFLQWRGDFDNRGDEGFEDDLEYMKYNRLNEEYSRDWLKRHAGLK